jgi:hypothetical protein
MRFCDRCGALQIEQKIQTPHVEEEVQLPEIDQEAPGRHIDLPDVIRSSRLFLPAVFFFGALLLRVVYASYVTPIDWNWDSYGHWQIAYYTLKVGLQHGRMWDLMGLEYYYPPLPILTESFLIWLFGLSLWNMRIFNMLIGSASAGLAYRVGTYVNSQVGILLGAIVAVFPILAFTDILALNETMMVFFAIVGLYLLYRTHVFFAGVAFGLASISHFAAYPLFVILVAYELALERSKLGVIKAIAGYASIMGLYLYLLHYYTGDWLYMFRIMGAVNPPDWTATWQIRIMYAAIGTVLIIPGLVGLLYIFLKKNRHVLLFFAFFELLFYGGLLTLRTPPLYGEERYYMLLSLFVSILLAYYLNSLRTRVRGIRFTHTLLVALIICSLLTISFAPRFISYQNEIKGFTDVADWIGPRYRGGTIISEEPVITYFLTTTWHIQADRNILGAHYIPIEKDLRTAWLNEHNVTWIIYSIFSFDFTNQVFPELADIHDHPPFFLAKSWGALTVYTYSISNSSLFRVTLGPPVSSMSYLITLTVEPQTLLPLRALHERMKNLSRHSQGNHV